MEEDKAPQWPGFTEQLPGAESALSPWTVTWREINFYFL